MLDFKRIELTDRSWAEELLAKADFRGSEYAFSNNYIYRKIYHIEVARMDDYYLVRTHKHDRELSYLFPAGAGDLRPVIDALAADAAGQGVPLVGVVYDQKISSFLSYIGQDLYTDLGDLTYEGLCEHIDRACARIGDTAFLTGGVDRLRQAERRNLETAARLLER